MKAIILAAGEGSRLKPLTNDKPKCLVELKGKRLIEYQFDNFKKAGINDIIIIKGYKIEAFPNYDAKEYVNILYNETNMVYSLFTARDEMNSDLIISYGDIVYDYSVLKKVLDAKGDIVIASDKKWLEYWSKRFDNPLDDAETFETIYDDYVCSLGKKPKSIKEIQGQYIGLIKCSLNGIRYLLSAYDKCSANEADSKNAWESGRTLKKAYMTDLLNFAASEGMVNCVEIERNWFEIDNLKDLEIAEAEFYAGN